ncbi:MAG: GntR family transcriptional regulator [Candidatus Sumerlaeota bacterium]|nr:GntR family transcriptional regulator [Candidatus Sumerlaeota bacterium]
MTPNPSDREADAAQAFDSNHNEPPETETDAEAVRELYGHKIMPSAKVTLAEQIHDVLCEEIHSGRWKIGERLPSLSTLVEISGLSRRSLLGALEMLREEGYIRQEERKGTFLSAILPGGRSPRGAVGIVIPAYSPAVSPAYAAWGVGRMHWVQKAAVERNFITEVFCLEEGADPRRIDSVEGPFGSRVKGIISLCPFPHRVERQLPPDRIPIVFAGFENEDCAPSVYGDSLDAVCQLTQQVIARGHRKILFCGSPALTRRESAIRVRGHVEAMREAGLPVDEKAIQRSLEIPAGDLAGHREFLMAFGEEATAIVCATCERAQNFIAVADVLGIRVPEDLSLVAYGPETQMRLNAPGGQIAGISFDTGFIVTTCFDLLLDQVKTRQCPVRRILVNPTVQEGDSLSTPRLGPARLSELVHAVSAGNSETRALAARSR